MITAGRPRHIAPMQRISRYRPTLALLLLSVVAVFYCHSGFLDGAFYDDDISLFGRDTRPQYIGYKFQPSTVIEALDAFSTSRHWYWRPAMLFYWFGMTAVFGESPVAFHSVTLIAHAVVIYLIGRLSYRVTKSFTAGALASLAVLLAPGNKEALAWAAYTSALVCAALMLAGAHAWLSFRQSGRIRYYVLSVGAVFLASLWKSDVFFVLPLLATLDACRGVGFRSLRALGPYAGMLLWMVPYALIDRAAMRSYQEVEPFLVNMGQIPVSQKVLHAAEFTWRIFYNPHLQLTCLALLFVALGLGFSITLTRVWRRAVIGLTLTTVAYTALLAAVTGAYMLNLRFLYFPVLFLFAAAGIGFAGALEEKRPSWLVPIFASAVLAKSAISTYESVWMPVSDLWIIAPVFAVLTVGFYAAYRWGRPRVGSLSVLMHLRAGPFVAHKERESHAK